MTDLFIVIVITVRDIIFSQRIEPCHRCGHRDQLFRLCGIRINECPVRAVRQPETLGYFILESYRIGTVARSYIAFKEQSLI